MLRWLPTVFPNPLITGHELQKETLLISLKVFPVEIYQYEYRFSKAYYFGRQFLDYGRYHGNVIFNDRQIYSYF